MTSTAPVKSQALHNFALSPLKWKNNHPRGRSSAAPNLQSRSESPLRQSPMKEGGKSSIDCINRHDCDVFVEKSERKLKVGLDHSGNVSFDCKESRSKILVTIPGVMQKNEGDKGMEEVELGANERKGDEVLQAGMEDDLMGRTWNLRPRKPIKKLSTGKGGEGGVGSKVGGSGSSVQGKTDALQKGNIENGRRIKLGSDVNVKKEKKVKFSISLTREEIEEDVFSLTGSKPTRRPKKRAKTVQKQLDNLFPGMWLASITPDSYKVSDNNYMKA
ncbi:hypothetical protein Leryth_025194 [Lithospermum erythrorhizon]|nr:hypothetical protein Leryth_025194 [Lithospermum erythrorhizon]